MFSDDCTGDPKFICGAGGTCTDAGVKQFTCSCDAGLAVSGPSFYERCLIDWLDDCVGDPCGSEGAVCTDEGVLSHSCMCLDGYKYPGLGSTQGVKYLTFANPADQQCSVTDEKITADALQLSCVAEYTACVRDATCSTDLDTFLAPLDSRDTDGVGVNGGVVSVDENLGGSAKFVMLRLCTMRAWAASAFTGPAPPPAGRDEPMALVVPVNACAQLPCRNRGTCTPGSDRAFTCSCASGFAGVTCEENIDDCYDGICSNGGVCVDKVESFECVCTNGWAGSQCNDRKRAVSITATIAPDAGSIAAFESQVATGLASSLGVVPSAVAVARAAFTPTIRMSWVGLVEDTPEFQTRMGVGLVVAYGGTAADFIVTILGDRRMLQEVAAPVPAPPPPLVIRTNSVVRASRNRRVPERVLKARRKAEASKAKNNKSDVVAAEAAIASNPWDTYRAAEVKQQEAEKAAAVAAHRRMQEATGMSLMITLAAPIDAATMTGALTIDTNSFFALVDPSGSISGTTSSMEVSAAVEAAVTQVATGNSATDGVAFDAVVSSSLANPSILATSLGVSSSDIQPLDLISLLVCTEGRLIDGSNRTPASPCVGEVGQECAFLCTNGERASGSHICQASGEFTGGLCGRGPALTQEQCPTSWEQLSSELSCDEQITFATDYHQPSKALSENGLWTRLQYWSDCNQGIELANVLPLTCGENRSRLAPGDATTCYLTSLPIGDATIQIQAWDSAAQSDATCTVTVHVVDEEKPVGTHRIPTTT